ncbi:MAG: hypothetical protein ACE5MM_08345 [Nitrospiraceae bacterium]
MLRTPDEPVRAQIEAAKAYLRDEGFTKVEDPPEIQQQAFERHLHTIRMRLRGETRILRLSYTWLEEHRPDHVSRWLSERDIGRSMREDADMREVGVLGDGTLQYGPIQFP